jgi:hypothetical protein
VQPERACWWIAENRIIGNRAIALPNGSPFCEVIVDYMKYIMEKGQVNLSIGWPGNTTAK